MFVRRAFSQEYKTVHSILHICEEGMHQAYKTIRSIFQVRVCLIVATEFGARTREIKSNISSLGDRLRIYWLSLSLTQSAGRSSSITFHIMVGWLLGFYDSTRGKDDTTVGVGHSRRYCNTGYDQSQGRRPSTLKCIGPISKGDIEPNHPSEINPNSDSR